MMVSPSTEKVGTNPRTEVRCTVLSRDFAVVGREDQRPREKKEVCLSENGAGTRLAAAAAAAGVLQVSLPQKPL